MASLGDIPDEIIRQILFYVSYSDNLNVQSLARRFRHVGNEPLLWRYYCRTAFEYWQPSHDFPQKLRQPVSEVDWKALCLSRVKKNSRLSRTFESLLKSKLYRMLKMEQICKELYDAKDFLLRQIKTDDSADDVLARRYYANMALDSIHRCIAVDVWSKYQDAPDSHDGLEQALGGFDMFVLHDQPQDLDYISTSLDNLAERFKRARPDAMEMPVRPRALSLMRWLRAENLVGMRDPDLGYRNVRNCLIGHALSDPEHDSLPIISCAIFSAVATRLGMNAFCCAFPGHVHSSVLSPPNQTLDGTASEPGTKRETMYLDPFGSDDETPIQALRFTLTQIGWGSDPDVFLGTSPVPVIVHRTAQNLKASYSTIQDLPDGSQRADNLRRLRAGHAEMNLEATFYAAMWAQLVTQQTSGDHWDAHLSSFLQPLALTWSEDAWIVEKYLVPLYDAFVARRARPETHRVGWENVHEILAVLRNLDVRQPTVSRRYTQDIRDNVRFKIGDVFRHKRYRYVGVINGWWVATGTMEEQLGGDMDEEDAAAAGDGAGGSGRVGTPSQEVKRTTYYTCLKSTLDRLRVIQENIELVTDPDLIPEDLFFMAGKFFKRFDRASCKFVSNIKEMYPDD